MDKKTSMLKENEAEHKRLSKKDMLYRFLGKQISDIGYEILKKSDKLISICAEKEKLERSIKELENLKCELKNKIDIEN